MITNNIFEGTDFVAYRDEFFGTIVVTIFDDPELMQDYTWVCKTEEEAREMLIREGKLVA